MIAARVTHRGVPVRCAVRLAAAGGCHRPAGGGVAMRQAWTVRRAGRGSGIAPVTGGSSAMRARGHAALQDGQRGFCFVRMRKDNAIVLTTISCPDRSRGSRLTPACRICGYAGWSKQCTPGRASAVPGTHRAGLPEAAPGNGSAPAAVSTAILAATPIARGCLAWAPDGRGRNGRAAGVTDDRLWLAQIPGPVPRLRRRADRIMQ